MFNKSASGEESSASGFRSPNMPKTHSQASQAPDVAPRSIDALINVNPHVDPLSPMSLLPLSPLEDLEEYSRFLRKQAEERGAAEEGARGIQQKPSNQDKKTFKLRSLEDLSIDRKPAQRRELPAIPVVPGAQPLDMFGAPVQQANRASSGEANTTWNSLGEGMSGSIIADEKSRLNVTTNRESLEGSSLWMTQSEESTRIPSTEFLEICMRMDKVEAHCQALTLENTILRTQISECMGFRAKIHALTYRLDHLALHSQSPSPYSSRISSPYEFRYHEDHDHLRSLRQYTEPLPSLVVDRPKNSHIQGYGANQRLLMTVPNHTALGYGTSSPSVASSSFQHPPHPPQVGPPQTLKPSTKNSYWNQRNQPEAPQVTNRAEPPPSSSPGPYRWLFVSKFKRSVTAEIISDYMAQELSSRRRPLACIALTRPDEPSTKPASFRVKLSTDDMEEALTPGFWAEGIAVKEYKARGAKSKKDYSKNSNGRPGRQFN